jgi:hypothetical protein
MLMLDFDSCLDRICESVLSEVFGRSLSRSPYLNVADCCRKPQEFDDALVDMFQPMGALLIETKILTRFYKSVGAKYSRSNDLNFAKEIGRARLVFAKGNGVRSAYRD